MRLLPKLLDNSSDHEFTIIVFMFTVWYMVSITLCSLLNINSSAMSHTRRKRKKSAWGGISQTKVGQIEFNDEQGKLIARSYFHFT